jgi:phage FluMu protein Com
MMGMQIMIYESLGGGYKCPHCGEINTCYSVEHRVVWNARPVFVIHTVQCELCDQVSEVRYQADLNQMMVRPRREDE